MVLPLVVLFVGFFLSVALKKRVASLQSETRRLQGRIGAAIADTVSGIRDLRLAAAVESRVLHLQKQFEKRRSTLVRQQLFDDLLSDLFRNLVLLGISIVLFMMSFLVGSEGFDVGKLVLFLTYTSWLGHQMYFFGKIFARYQNGKVSYERLNQIAAEKSQSRSPLPTPSASLKEFSVEQLSYQPAPMATAPVPLNFRARPGELIAISGKIGTGKSRLVRALLGLEPFATGKIFWNDIEITRHPEWMRSPRVSYSGQSPRFLRGTLEENVALGLSNTTRADVKRTLRSVHLDPGSPELHHGVPTQIETGDAGQLSGGQKQRLALARMLLRDAELYIVDDCDSSLDSETAHFIWRKMRDQRHAVWIVVSQNQIVLQIADQVITLQHTERRSLRGPVSS